MVGCASFARSYGATGVQPVAAPRALSRKPNVAIEVNTRFMGDSSFTAPKDKA